jgi:hypothetical protein
VSMPVPGDENGSFLAKLEVPGGTFPKAYKLVLSVDCHGDPQQDTAELKVENQVSIRYAASGHGVRRADDPALPLVILGLVGARRIELLTSSTSRITEGAIWPLTCGLMPRS